MFPVNFVSLLTEQANARSGGVQGRCRAVFSYQPANPDELPLSVGDVLEVLGEVEEGWWQGRRQGRVGVFPSNFVVMLDPPQPAPPFEPAPALPPKPVKEQCRVLFPYTAVNDDELTLAEGDIVTIVSKDAPDRGWWRGELLGRQGLFPDNFVQMLPAVAAEAEEKKPDRPPSKTNAIYPVLNKYSEKTASVKELTTSKISLHKENTISKESTTQSTVTHTNKTESEKLIHNESVNDGTLDGQIKKPPVPLKKSPTPSAGVGGLFSGLKTKMLSSTDKEKSSSTTVSSGSSSGGEWDRPDGAAASRPPSNTLDHVERNSMLNDPRAHRVKAPRRRPPSQALRDDTPQQIGLSNGHEVPTEREKPPAEKAEEIKPRAREWEKHKAPWMEELKLNQAKKTSFGADGKSRSVSTGSESGVASKAGGGSTDRILECGLEEKRSTHSMEMSKSTSSISSRMSVLESFEETKVRHSLDSKKELNSNREDPIPAAKPTLLNSPTAAGRTLLNMLDEIKKPQAPPPPVASTRPPPEPADKSPNAKTEKIISNSEKIVATSEKLTENIISRSSGIFEKSNTLERIEKIEEKIPEKPNKTADKSASGTLERRLHSLKAEKVEPAKQDKAEKIEKSEGTEALIAQLNSRISNLEKIIEVQNSMFTAAVEELSAKLQAEADKRQALQAEVAKLAHCVTQV
ncbi:SH3 domain-containing kinase-binding protein 1-like isoform X2 [Ostrinia furnacalis]|uniref:SH3 domain-containing kinase-binding protein 1-like isoform X2 n=1 Tax=Ostrinia furnacalis TaxID=93504 RepID=UPI00103E1441|nr:SH3 domain-containing kinase-binding protein 1-like isoform X2 [Ostrinia furnacalis]